MADAIDDVLDRLARNIETAVHALYRGDVRQATAKARTGHLVREAADALRAHAGPRAVDESRAGTTARTSAPVVGSSGWSPAEAAAVTKCITAWLAMGSPATATPDSKCIAAGREMVPTWGERELARAAVRRLAVR
jgi:hypothetical protein